MQGARLGPPRSLQEHARDGHKAIKNMEFNAAKKYLEDVIAMRRCIVFRRFCGSVGRTAQAKNEGSTNGQGRWPKKSAEMLLNILKNAESNAEVRRAASRSLAGFFRGRRMRAEEAVLARAGSPRAFRRARRCRRYDHERLALSRASSHRRRVVPVLPPAHPPRLRVFGFSRMATSHVRRRAGSFFSDESTSRRACAHLLALPRFVSTGQGSRRGCALRVPHSGEPRHPAAPPHLPRPRSHQPRHELSLPRRGCPLREG